MKLLKRFAYLMSATAFSAFTLLAYAPRANANSYPGGNWKLTFYSPVDDEDTSQEIYTVNLDGSDLKQITNDDIQQSNPQWSPDMTDRQIAFDQDDDVNDDETSTGQDRNIYIQNIDSTGAADGTPSVLSGANTCENEWDPSWSPSGEKIAFHRTSEVRDDCSVGDAGGPNHIFTIDSSGGTAEARTGGGAGDADYRDTEPTWNKDGDTLVFTRTDTSDDSTVIATVPADGDESNVTIIPGSDGGNSPQWSPATNSIVYAKDGDYWTYNIGDSDSVNLTNGEYDFEVPFAPTYSPDDVWIYGSGNAGIEALNLDTGDLYLLSVDEVQGLDFSAADGVHEVDQARMVAPENTDHECTTYVNTDCTDFEPEIPEPCASGGNPVFTTTAEHGTPKFSNGTYTFTPTKDYVGEDQYVYTYLDEHGNSISCNVKITVLPKAPDTGAPNESRTTLIGAITAAGALSAGYVYKKKRFARR